MNRVRAEFDSVIAAEKDKPITEVLKNDLTMEKCNDMTYLGCVIHEALRVNPAVPTTSYYHFEKDTTIGTLKVKAYDPILISIHPLHHSSKHWQEPSKFNPDRFDQSHPDSKTPDGKKRPQMSWLPFNGGKRICFGKTFAEAALKMIISMMAQRFNFEFVETGKYDKDNLPMLMLGQTHYPKIPVKLSKYVKKA